MRTYCLLPTRCVLTTYQVKLLETRAMRAQCAPIFLPLFDHCLTLAADSYAQFTFRGHPYLAQRAGRELAYARKVARYEVCAVCGQPIVRGTDRCSADETHDARGAFTALEATLAGVPCDVWNACAALK